MAYNAWFFYRDLFKYACQRNNEYVGRDIHILSKRAIGYFFDGFTVCGGCTHGLPNIYIFMQDNALSNPEDAIADIITHECLHQVLFLLREGKAWKDLDNIHFMMWRFFAGQKLPETYSDFVGSGNWDKSKIHGGLAKKP